MSEEIAIRAALPEDAAQAVPLIYCSGPTTFDYVFHHPARGTSLDFLHRAYRDGEGEFGYRCHLVATQAGEVVGVGAGYSGRTGLRFMWAAMRQILAQYGPSAGSGVIARGLRTEGVIPPPAAHVYYIAHLGVRPELRGRGIGERISRYLIEAGAQAGFQRAALDVSVGNPRAQSLYERLGFVVTREHASRLANSHGRVLDHRRMERAI